MRVLILMRSDSEFMGSCDAIYYLIKCIFNSEFT